MAIKYTRLWGIYKHSDGKVQNGVVTVTPSTNIDNALKAANTHSVYLKNGKFSIRVLSSDSVGVGGWTSATPYSIVVDLDGVTTKTFAGYSVTGPEIDLANELPVTESTEINDDVVADETAWSSSKIVDYIYTLLPSVRPGVVFTTTGSTFTPVLELVENSTASISWIDMSSTAVIATGTAPDIDFGSTATRAIKMLALVDDVAAYDDILTLNLGFNTNDDAGRYNVGGAYNHTAQACSGVTGLTLLTGLKRFLAANGNLTGQLDFSGLSDLEFIECYDAYVTSVDLTGCTSLIRLCLEHNSLTTLNLNPVAANLRDLRAAYQRGNAITFTALTSNLANLYHWCVRDQVVTGHPASSRFIALEEMWNWGTGQTGTLTIPATATDVRPYGNSYTSVTDEGRTATGGYLAIDNNSLTSATLTTPWSNIDLSDNNLNEAAVDAVIDAVESWNTSNGTLDLTGNTAPSSAGVANVTTLRSRGWTIAVDISGGPTVLWEDLFDRADATGVANVGNGWAADIGGDINIVSNDVVLTGGGIYRRYYNTAGADLPADLVLEVTLPAATMGSYWGLIARFNPADGTGVRVLFTDYRNSITVGNSTDYIADNITLTPVSGFPAGWATDGIDHKLAVYLHGSTIDIYCDDQHSHTGTITVNQTLANACVGFCGEGNDRAWHQIRVLDSVA